MWAHYVVAVLTHFFLPPHRSNMSARQRRQPWVMQATALYDYDPEGNY